jgi:hypothetical protein
MVGSFAPAISVPTVLDRGNLEPTGRNKNLGMGVAYEASLPSAGTFVQ